MIIIDYPNKEIYEILESGSRINLISNKYNWIGGDIDHYMNIFFNNIEYYKSIRKDIKYLL